MHRCCFISIDELDGLTACDAAVEALIRQPDTEAATARTVQEILAQVRAGGFDAVRALTARFDGVTLEGSARVAPGAMAEARARLDRERPALMAALRRMIAQVRRFAEGQRACLSDLDLPLPGGGSVGERWVPLERVGVYIPGGRAFYPSTLVMTVVPAQVAGVGRIVGVTPPKSSEAGNFGVDPLVLATAAELGLEELHAVGGAQAVTWLAHGEPRVDLVAGPGNRFVAEAKRQLLGTCGIDAVAGPTEVLVIADASADPTLVAEDLLAQAEHDPDAAAVLVSESRSLLEAVGRELAARVAASPRRELLEQSLGRHGRLFLAPRELAIAFAQAWAPEHLELVVADPEAWLPRLGAAGAVFLGASSGEAFGDYGAGPNHVLPTMRTARYTSPLGVATYLKRQSLIRLSPADAADLAPTVAALAEAEGLPHHGRSASLRAHHLA